MKNKEREIKLIRNSRFKAISPLMLDFLSIYDFEPMNFVKRSKISNVVPVVDELISISLKKLCFHQHLFHGSDKVLFSAIQEYAEMKNLEKLMPDELTVQNPVAVTQEQSQEYDAPLPIMRMSRRRRDGFGLL